jgi:hypothetical protein
MIPPKSLPLIADVRRTRARVDLELHKLVLAEEEETARMRRRFHIHVVLLGLSGFLAYLSVVDIVSLTIVTLTSPCFLLTQEYIDRVGRF